MNKKGQALVEFVIVFPILIFIVMAIIDFGSIYTNKIELQNNLSDIVNLYKKEKFVDITNIVNKNKYTITYNQNLDTTEIVLKKNVHILTPFLNVVLGNDYTILDKRVIFNE